MILWILNSMFTHLNVHWFWTFNVINVYFVQPQYIPKLYVENTNAALSTEWMEYTRTKYELMFIFHIYCATKYWMDINLYRKSMLCARTVCHMECNKYSNTQIYNISNHMWYIFAFIFHHIKKPEQIDASIQTSCVLYINQ